MDQVRSNGEANPQQQEPIERIVVAFLLDYGECDPFADPSVSFVLSARYGYGTAAHAHAALEQAFLKSDVLKLLDEEGNRWPMQRETVTWFATMNAGPGGSHAARA